MRRNTYRPGDNLTICDRTGFTVYMSDTVKEWNGLRVRKASYEPRQSQDFVKGRIDRPAVPDARPRPADVFLEAGDVTAESL